MISILKKIILGYKRDRTPVRDAYKNQWIMVLKVWRNRTSDDYGIERLVRLVLSLFPFLTLALFIRRVFGKYGQQVRNLAIDTYVVLKVVLSLVVLVNIDNPWWLVVPLYFGVETIMYIFSLIFLSDQHHQAVLIRRTIILVLLNFLELNITYASLYMMMARRVPASFHTPTDAWMGDPLTAVYFSFITAGTIGYGDISPATPLARWVVLGQITLSFIFVVLFISYFTGRFTQFIHQGAGRRAE